LNQVLTETIRVTGLFGYPVIHSFSPAMQNAAFRALGLNYIYVPFCVHADNLGAAVESVRALGICGVNITIPHKERVIPYLDWVSEDAARIGSVNTIHNYNGTLKGYSTDGPGFIRSLKSVWRSPSGCRAVVLGAGGAARAAVYALVKEGADVWVANRTFLRAVELARSINTATGADRVVPVDLLGDHAKNALLRADLLVNCTSVGMYPNVNEQPVPEEWLHPGLFVYDQVYNPLLTKLQKSAQQKGAETSGGLGMLVHQGAASFEIWTEQAPSLDIMYDAVLGAMGAGHSEL
jgi:shikimate dehydrogenase